MVIFKLSIISFAPMNTYFYRDFVVLDLNCLVLSCADVSENIYNFKKQEILNMAKDLKVLFKKHFVQSINL